MHYAYALAAGALLLALRVAAVRRARFARYDALHAKFAHLLEDPSKMTYQESEEIQKVMQSYDMPWIAILSLSFALFKTYAIPTISLVLNKSGQLSDPAVAARRAEDTAVFIGEFLYGGLDSERGCVALARLNWLHGRYGALITRDNLLYTLSLFVFEPAVWAKKYEWRGMSELEQEARYIFWREIGARMGIADIPSTRAALLEWSVAYADRAEKYAPQNKSVGDATFHVLLKPMPGPLKAFGKRAGIVFLPDRTREAFGYAPAPWVLRQLVPALLSLKGWVCGYLLMPRATPPDYVEAVVVKDEKGGEKLVRHGFLFEPWYCAPGSTSIGALGTGKPGKGWHEGGFMPETLGPERLMAQGVELSLKNGAEMRTAAMACPFFRPS
ncbi:hypothetical protein Q8F55_000182 [Vanrija albida]|uniref:ER-bound oxygenase mpaB/mpaB'/Rubber oxygenase catalytic domain-containing protein n=1 Tax=Vanrija albida TaxID=181172 RepID=A0ABR3QCP2_9TREE